MNEVFPTSAEQEESQQDAISADEYGIVEIMGHRRIAGRISRESLGVVALLRVDVPALPAEPATEERGDNGMYHGRKVGTWITDETPERPAYTQLFGASAIFSIRVCSAEEALADEIERREDQPNARFVPDESQPSQDSAQSCDDRLADPFTTDPLSEDL